MLTKEQLSERAQLVRIHEANCNIQHPSPIELNFRVAILKKIALALDLREVRNVAITGPADARIVRR